MDWLRRLFSGGRESPAGAGSFGSRRMAHPRYSAFFASLAAGGALRCGGCGDPLGFDPEDEPDGEGRGRHICGECNRARNFDAEMEALGALDPGERA